MTQILEAIALAAIVAVAAWRAKALTADGSVAAFAVGAATFASGGWSFAGVLFAFFIPAMILSRFGRARKAALIDTGKHGPRDAFQVLANGAVAATCAIAYGYFHSRGYLVHGSGAKLPATIAAAAFAGAFAAAAADTFGTEIGTLSAHAPRSILTGRAIARGLSGGITATGTFAELIGASVAGLAAASLGVAAWWIVTVAGFAGAVVDSILGATVQALYYCSRCGRHCETAVHGCGASPALVRGFRRINNDAVNAAATLTGAAIGALLAVYFTAR